MFSDGLNPAKGSPVRGLQKKKLQKKNHLVFARKGKNETEKIKRLFSLSPGKIR